MNDRDIRLVLLEKLEEEHAGDSNTLVLQEVGVDEGSSRVDLAVLNGRLHGYEIKSDRDTLDRLPGQIHAYGKCFDRVTLVVGQKHLSHAVEIAPPWWEIVVARRQDGRVVLDAFRAGSENPGVDASTLVRLLWREEARDVLVRKTLARVARTYKRHELWAMILKAFEVDELREVVRETVKARGDWRVAKRQARDNDSSSTTSSFQDYQTNLDWLLHIESPNHPN